MDREIIKTTPPSPSSELLRDKFDEDIAHQAQRLNELAKLLITVGSSRWR